MHKLLQSCTILTLFLRRHQIATFGDLGLMGQDGLSTKTGPIGGDNFTELGQYETNTIQSLLMNKDSYDFMYHVGDIG